MQLFVTAQESNTWEGEKEERVSGGAGGGVAGAVVCTLGENMLINLEAPRSRPKHRCRLLHHGPTDPEESGAE